MLELADFVILSDDPTAVDPETLADLRVQFSIKEGEVIYDAENEARAGNRVMPPLANDLVAAHHLLSIFSSAVGKRRSAMSLIR